MNRLDVPIFDSISNFVRRQLEERHVHIKSYRRWEEPVIRAAGFEAAIDVSAFSDVVDAMVINWDWDVFREALLASQLNGMAQHPLLKDKSLVKFELEPTIDIEISWHLSKNSLIALNGSTDNKSMDAARKWMEQVNDALKPVLNGHDLINRWHVEMEGTAVSRTVTSVSLISYVQYSFIDLQHLELIQRYLGRKLQNLLLLNAKILRILTEKSRLAA